MALIKCPECGREISDRAPVCLGCGITKEDIQEMLKEKKESSSLVLEQTDVSEQEVVSVTSTSAQTTLVESEEKDENTTSILWNELLAYPTVSPVSSKVKFAYSELHTSLVEEAEEEKNDDKLSVLSQDINSNKSVDVDEIFFGTYNNRKIKWRVLKKEDSRVLVISDEAVAICAYQERRGNDIYKYTFRYESSWEHCDLRKWLNNIFYNSAFSFKEKGKILLSYVTASMNPEYTTSPGNSTRDKIFLLSIDEVNEYFKDDTNRQCILASEANNNEGPINCWWWLRSPGNNETFAATVRQDGSICFRGSVVDFNRIGVRPAMWLDSSYLQEVENGGN